MHGVPQNLFVKREKVVSIKKKQKKKVTGDVTLECNETKFPGISLKLSESQNLLLVNHSLDTVSVIISRGGQAW